MFTNKAFWKSSLWFSTDHFTVASTVHTRVIIVQIVSLHIPEVKWKVVSPDSRYGHWESISNIYKKNGGVSFWTCWREISGDRVALSLLHVPEVFTLSMTYMTLRVVIYTHRVTVMYLYTSSSISAVSQVGIHFYLIILMYLKSISVLELYTAWEKIIFQQNGCSFYKKYSLEKSDYLFGTDLDIIMGGGGGV